jgi:hypothetical protein
MPGKYKSTFAKFRCGVAPFKIETGRYEGVSVENRTCFNNICNVNNCIENENHALLECPVYADLCCYLFEHACLYNNNFMQLSDDEKIVFFSSDESIKVITKLPNSEQSYKGKVKTHNYINRQIQSTTGKL